ncbi:2-desacetyl-2-hydroxyethyl bacteriochlorophyllide A dehydrogenase [Friedmanniella endophytica]|uniref:2-desacetyl-2-hydroxyethyl bacteriochlorophyllide A dehydrogenase n=1 Tax=Microlunatus kandeliicorticis TaxID=1759536 RepID=A0A7W3IUB5_9ACTN|nr:alcohol dehydrogenase catalytic domain-containing protein [Microlunatus kandeliicorticis]MBA8795378.1 2-desacetyl-2-hydroxyethyl bacteriochlorophyllide A dehydrogenase [Microlunatus kandeliicorticis]
MKALVLAEVARFEVREVDEPVPGPGEVRIAVRQSGICGSELGGFTGSDGLRHPGLVFGHELVGVVDRYGPGAEPAPRLTVGAPVTANPLRSCGRCPVCASGRPNVCPHRQLLGAHLPGSNAEFVVVPADALHPLDGFARPERAVLAEPAACAVRAVAQAGPAPGATALVLGAGPIGLLLIEVLRLRGVGAVWFTEPHAGRGEAARACGAVELDSDPERLAARIGELTGGYGVDVVFDAVGSTVTRQSATRVVRSGGTVCLVGLHTHETPLPVRDLIRREVTLTTSFAYTPDDFAAAVELLRQEELVFPAGLVHARLEQGQHWYELLLAGDPAGKVVLEPPR